MAENAAYFLEKLHIYIFLFKNSIYMRSCTANLTREPGYRTFLTSDLVSNGMADVDLHLSDI